MSVIVDGGGEQVVLGKQRRLPAASRICVVTATEGQRAASADNGEVYDGALGPAPDVDEDDPGEA